MLTILASSPTRDLTEEYPIPMFDERNGFVDFLKERWKEPKRCLMIAAFPDRFDMNDEMTDYYRRAAENVGLSVECFDLWDRRWQLSTPEEVHSYDIIFLAGGHIPTEMDWFREIGLKALLEGYTGIVLGTSAGSMNAAEEVYAWPEEPGESFKGEDELFYEGLGLCRTQIVPHYQKVKDNWLDGRHMFHDITCSQSFGRKFYAIPDSSYVVVENGVETLYGDAWLIADGEISRFCVEGKSRRL